MLKSAELKGCVKWFIYFLDPLYVKYNCAKFHHCTICMTDFKEGASLPPIREQSRKGPSWIRLILLRYGNERSYSHFVIDQVPGSFMAKYLFDTLCAILYHLHNFKNLKITKRGVSLLVKLQTKLCNFTQSNIPSWVFLAGFFNYANGTKLCKAPHLEKLVLQLLWVAETELSKSHLYALFYPKRYTRGFTLQQGQ